MILQRRLSIRVLMLSAACLTTGSGLASPADDPPVDREVVEAKLKQRRDELEKLEGWVQVRRDEVKLQMSDFATAQQGAVAKAEKEYQRAKDASKESRYKLGEYLKGIYLQDKATYTGAIILAQSDLERSIDRRKELEEKARQGNDDPNKRIVADLEVQQSQFDVEQAQMQLYVLEKYTKAKETKLREAALDAAIAIETERKGLLEVEQAKAAKFCDLAAKLHVRSPEDLVIALIDDAVKNEGKALGILADAQKLEAQIREKPQDGATLGQQLVAKKDEALSLMNQAKTQLLEAAHLGEQVRASRAKLRDDEQILKKERQLFEILESQLTPKK